MSLSNHARSYVVALSLWLILGSNPSRAHAQTPRQRISVMDVFEIRTVADPQISPDGRRIAYMLNFADIRTDTRYSNLWTINYDGTDSRPITSGNFHDSSPRWSPDGKRIAFISDRDGSPQIYERWLDTSEMHKITNLAEAPSGLAWSPDGQQIAFLSLVPGQPRKLGKLPDPPPGAKWADPPHIIDKLVYRFDQIGYIKPGETQLFVVASDGSAPRQISQGKLNISSGTPGGSTPVWSPDNKSIILSANRNADAEDNPLNTDIYEFSTVDGSVKTLTTRKGPDNSPALSRDGRRIAYGGFDDKHQGYQVTHLYVMLRDGSDARDLAPDFDRDVSSPRWAPDGRGVYFIYTDRGDTKLGYAPLDGKMQPVCSHLGSGVSAYGGGDALSVANDGRFVTTLTNPEDPGNVAVGRLGASIVNVITHENRELLDQRKTGSVEEIWFDSSKDHRKLEAWIIKPPDFDPSRKYPLILEIHGGPFANYGDRFDFEKQVMAAKDYVVVYANPRGSTSYGGEFGNLIHHAYRRRFLRPEFSRRRSYR